MQLGREINRWKLTHAMYQIDSAYTIMFGHLENINSVSLLEDNNPNQLVA